MALWDTLCDKIFDFLNFDDDTFERPTYHKITEESARYLQTKGTCLRDMSGYGLSDDIWHLQNGSLDYQVFTLFHECWHVMQKQKGRLGEYSDEHKQKYLRTSQSMMLYKHYEFEAEATGYAAAFVYLLYEFVESNKKGSCKFGRQISDSFDNIEKFPEECFDTHEDFLIATTKIKKYYEEGKSYLLNLLRSDLNNLVSALEPFKEKMGDIKYLSLVSKKASQLVYINKYL